MAQGGGVVGLFIARRDLLHALFEQVMGAKVHPSRLAWVWEHRGEGSRYAQLLIRVFEQDKASIGSQTASIEVQGNGFLPQRC
jgi:hypothetical protein